MIRMAQDSSDSYVFNALMQTTLAEITNSTEDYNYSDYEGLVFLCDDNSEDFGGTFSVFCLVFIFCLSLIGNSLVLYTVWKYENLKKVTNIFILNLAISDLVFSFSLPFWAVYHIHGWIFGKLMCKLLSGIFFLGFYSCMMFLTIMTIDRYMAVVHAMSISRIRQSMFAYLMSAIIWTICICASIPEMLITDTKGSQDITLCESIEMSVNFELLLYFIQIIIFFVVPFAIIVYCYIGIMKTIKNCRMRRKQKAVKQIFTIVVGFFLCWTPYNIILFLFSLQKLGVSSLTECDVKKKLHFSFFVCQNLAYLYCCLNPLFYVFLGVKFRRHLASLICGFKLQIRDRSQTFSSQNSAPRHSAILSDIPLTSL
ncbi:chemokine XC receptor 1-like [Amia ocellicauda]|uniref:chemokine XC receptor 1-like n=1 Tax=Amia ocellicauda TaxID=2972642 RepID=UPI003464D5DA